MHEAFHHYLQLKQLFFYFSSNKKTDNKDFKELKRLLQSAVEISENEFRSIRKLHGFVEQEKRECDPGKAASSLDPIYDGKDGGKGFD